MSLNPYASDDFNRMKVKAEKDYETQKAEREASRNQGQVEHPLVEGKKLDVSAKELKTFTKAMEQKEFRSMLNEYVDEISDPKHAPELKQYLLQMEQQGDLPPGTELIQPKAGFCIKTSCKKLMSDINKSYFDQKCFINVCFHEKVPKAKKELASGPDGN
jgi:hypothetical protein